MSTPEISVYAGAGSSHSWAWLADLFESHGLYRVRFHGTREFISSLEDGTRTAIVSGGDGFSIASALSGRGFERLENFIGGGGLYVGICAGAYLPLPSSVAPFSEFNLSSTRIENIDCRLDQVDALPPRVAVRYGRCAIVHPIRGEIELGRGTGTLRAPLYGGPVFKEPEKDEVLLRYSRFTENTEFQFGQRAASSLVLGRAASIRVAHGSGSLLLLGPHLEHPKYADANSLFLELLGLSPSGAARVAPRLPPPTVSAALADLKVAIVGLENRSFVVGKKVWDGSRFLELHRAIEQRAWSLDEELAGEVVRAVRDVRGNLVQASMGSDSDVDESTSLLVETARKTVDNHFQSLVGSR